jgi:hypothetical protein
MAQLKEEWTESVKTSIRFFEKYHEEMLQKSAALIISALTKSVSLKETLNFKSEKASSDDKKKLEERYKDALRKIEVSTQKSIEKIWNHEHLEKDQNPLSFEEMDLFSEESASVFGLTRKELLLTAVTSGAVTGAGIDLLLAGHTLFIGGVIGAVAGGVGAYFAFNELSEIKVLGQELGKRYLEIGPMENRNFPYILLGRLLYHTQQIAKRSHAERDVAAFRMESTFKEKWLDDSLKKSLESYHKKFRSGKTLDLEVLTEYEGLVEDILEKLLAE